MTSSAKDFYRVLGVPENASQEEIKKAYRRLAHQHHPDRAGGSEEKFKEINTAYQILSDTEKRARYDAMRKYGYAFGGNGRSPFGFDFSSAFGEPQFGSLEDLLQEFFGGGFRVKTQPRQNIRTSTGITFHGPNGTSVYIEVTGPKSLDPHARQEVEKLGKQLVEFLAKEFGKPA